MTDWITGESAANAPLGRPKPAEAAAGDRYDEHQMAMLDSER